MVDKASQYLSRLEAVDAEILTPMVRELYGDSALIVCDWKYEPISGGFGGAAGPSLIYRYSGSCKSGNEDQSWSLILKIILLRKGEAPADPKYWKREYELYRADLLADLPSGIAAPRGFGVVDYTDESVWIWMEDIQGDLEQPWSEAQYARIGRHFGQFNGAYLTGKRMPAAAWLSDGWMPKTMVFLEKEEFNAQIVASFAQPMIKTHFPSGATKQYSRLWDDRKTFLGALERLPKTFAHQDGTGRNLFARLIKNEQYETIATDWAFAGEAPIGLDAAMPVIIDVFLGDLDPAQAETNEQIVFNGYINGLQDAGWDGSVNHVRLGYTASTALKYLELICAVPFIADEKNYASFEQGWGRPVADIIDIFAGMHHYACTIADEARKLSKLTYGA